MTWFEAAALLCAVTACTPLAVLCVELAAAFAPRRPEPPVSAARPSVAVLVPAHDEAADIATTVRALLAQLQPGDRLVVVADNCSDATAALARGAGAEVAERRDPSRRGKGYALDFGVRHLAQDPPDVVIVVDADCVAGDGALERLARLAVRLGRPVQALYEMACPPGAGLRVRVAAFAWRVKNHARPLGLRNLGLPCQLMGTGMAFPWNLIRSAALATGEIVEDIAMGVALARQGAAPRFCPEARVWSSFPSGDEGLRSQRTRWEHGHLGMMRRAPALLLEALRRRDFALAALAIDLCVPPLALLALVLFVVPLAGTLVPGAGGEALVASGLAACGLFGMAILAVWLRFGRDVLTFPDLLRIPVYMAWKLPIYVRYLIARESRWVRTPRSGD